MRRLLALLIVVALAGTASCRKAPEGDLKVLVIGDDPKLRDPALGALSQPEQVLLANVAQGLVRFDPAGNIVGGVAERWTVSDDGLSYIFRLAPISWADGRKVTAEQVARALKRAISARSKNSLKDRFGAAENITAMTDRVIEIELVAPRPDLLSLLAQPEMALLRNGRGTGPFQVQQAGADLRLTRDIVSPDDETARSDALLLGAAPARAAVRAFVAGDAALVLGGSFVDLPAVRSVRLPRDSLRFDPASGLFGLVALRSRGALADPAARAVLSEAIDRDSFIAALAVPGLVPRATLLEPGLDGMPAPAAPAWLTTPYSERLPQLQERARNLFGNTSPDVMRVALPDGAGADLLLELLQRSWGALGLTVERAATAAAADFALIDEVAPSSSPAWFVRHFRCGSAPLCDPEIDALMDAARQSPVPGQRYALLGQAAARIDIAHLFIPIAAPIRWSLVSSRIQSFAGNRYARHTLTDLEVKPTGGE